MELQAYLRRRGLDSLCQQYNIKANRHHQYPHLVCLKYSQIDSPLGEKVVQQCRGIILDEAQNWQIVSYSYNKFFNYGEVHAAQIDWSQATVYDKLDGSLMVLYFYDGQWQVQSSGTPDATGNVGDFNLTFAQLFWQVWQSLGYQLPQETDYCFSFELMTPYNRIVVKQESKKIVLHGVRNVLTLKEEKPAVWGSKYAWEVVKSFPLSNWTEIIKAAAELDPMDAEGYIVCDSEFNRVKVKSPQYVAIAHLRENFSTRRMLEIILNNEGDEFLSYFPEWTEFYEKIIAQYNKAVQEIEAVYQQYKDIPVQKDFALAIKHLPYAGILFALRAGKSSSVKESLRQTSIPKVEQLLGIENIYLGV
ncbi:MAG: T4 RnlA family RNA ligase [Gomphosphaeria aponina SAG 52.96 = DSM 107014]|uniref:T4 RnlA family RNA ligase n=1 Tax=Gomphosphaeria aponina SAG 52.96 = DSM 107014 TaxID=1521640 RepID=A0A941GWF0_9CHRO|nr:T4 RnlA family RNA ligase [Gomphosphaeria aponina SAG 52.96 = DSM 107014]